MTLRSRGRRRISNSTKSPTICYNVVVPSRPGNSMTSLRWLVPRSPSRALILEGIANGIGRAAVHEFAHMILPKAQIHDSQDISSYEYRSAARREKYYGELRWERAWPLLQARFARCSDRGAS